MTRRAVLLAGLALCAGAAAQQRTQAFGVPTAVAQYRELSQTLEATATAAADEARLTTVTAHFDGWVESMAVSTTFQAVAKGEVLCTLYSPAIHAAEQEYAFARRNQQALSRSTVSGVAAGAAALLRDARQRLAQQQVPAEEIARLEKGGEPRQRFVLRAPASGYVRERQVLPGAYVTAGTRLYTLGGLQPIWVNVAVPESQLGRVHTGQTATVTFDAYPGRIFSAQVALVPPQVEADSRTAAVRLVLPNREAAVSPGMFGRASLTLALGRELTVPADAVLRSGEQARVFVAGADGSFLPRTVQLGKRVGEVQGIRGGLRAGERVATGASFLVDSEAQLAAAAGSFAPPPPGAGQTAAEAPPTATMELTTAPSPARKGANTFRLLLRDARGVPITGAEVALTLSMPAMPAMGMAAMHVAVSMHEAGGGRYEGRAELGSGGRWQVLVVARKAGQVVARQTSSLRAEGGM
jgi:Cu(I)/Ag(I) efflux system membrane fusion protein/cobalt-zinc-cadmium efflux system membrane fusion protein